MSGLAKAVDGCGHSAYGDAMGLRIGALIVDSQDPGRLARFWAAALDWVISQDEDPEWVVEPPEGSRDDCVVADLLIVDSQDPGRLARFWAAALDWVISQDEDPEWVVEPPEGSRDDCVVADL